MKNTNIYLVRHAHSKYTADDINRPLSGKGFKDAEIVVRKLADKNINHIVTSPYKRALQTVKGLADVLSLEIEINDGFRERKLSEEVVINFEESVLRLWRDFNFKFLGGESGKEAQRRGVNAIQSILTKYAGSNIVIGTHGNIMVLIMNYFDDRYDYEFWKNLNMPDIYKLSFGDKIFLGAEKV